MYGASIFNNFKISFFIERNYIDFFYFSHIVKIGSVLLRFKKPICLSYKKFGDIWRQLIFLES